MRSWKVVVLACVVACSRSKKPTGAAPSASASGASVAVDAGPADIELIWGTGARVGVSSFVDNDKDLPEHIADHDVSTAWIGKTGDLVGGFISARLGHDKYIHYATLIVGFDKKTPAEDLFTTNHRITRVRVDCMRDDIDGFPLQALREVDLDPEVRQPQRVLVDALCWDLKLVVTGVKPGTRQQLAVSEFGLYGWEKPPDPPEPPYPGWQKPPGPPPAPYHGRPDFNSVGGYSMKPKAFLAHGATYKEACAKVMADEEEDNKPLTCGAPVVKASSGAILEIAHVPYSAANFHGELLGFRTSAGAFITYVSISGRSSLTSYRIKSQKSSGDALVVDVEDTYTPEAGEPRVHVRQVACHAGPEAWCSTID